MNPLVLLIGNEEDINQRVIDLIGHIGTIEHVAIQSLMSAIYELKPSCLIVNTMSISSKVLGAISADVGIEYLPVITIESKVGTSRKSELVERSFSVLYQEMDMLLEPVVRQALILFEQYSQLRVGYETHEVMNDEIKGAMDIYLDPILADSEKGLLYYFDLIYKNNLYLDSRPTCIWLINQVATSHYSCMLFDLKVGDVIETLVFDDESYSLKPFMETGFFINYDRGALSDIVEVKQIVPTRLMRYVDDIINAACYASGNDMLIAMNYNDQIVQSDLNILRALTVKSEMMVSIKKQIAALDESFLYTMNALARAAEGKDQVTGKHIKRVNMFASHVASRLGMGKMFVHQIEISAQMHDVGKVLIKDSILNKPGRLTEDEFASMKEHTVFGQQIIGESEHLQMAAEIARSHHEKYDGTGYPDGLKGEEIPISARIVSIGDVYDALRSPRAYKPGFTHKEACQIIIKGDGRVEPSHFDPRVLDIFRNEHEAFDHIYESLKD